MENLAELLREGRAGDSHTLRDDRLVEDVCSRHTAVYVLTSTAGLYPPLSHHHHTHMPSPPPTLTPPPPPHTHALPSPLPSHTHTHALPSPLLSHTHTQAKELRDKYMEKPEAQVKAAVEGLVSCKQAIEAAKLEVNSQHLPSVSTLASYPGSWWAERRAWVGG